MDFEDTPEEASFRAEVRAWLEAHSERKDPNEIGGDALGERHDAQTIERCKAWQAKKFDDGWAGITWPKEYGGRGGTAIQSVICWRVSKGPFGAAQARAIRSTCKGSDWQGGPSR